MGRWADLGGGEYGRKYDQNVLYEFLIKNLKNGIINIFVEIFNVDM